MSENTNYGRPALAEAQELDLGLRAYMIGVYQFMMLGIALTAGVAWLVSMQHGFVDAVWSSRMFVFGLAFLPIPVCLYLQARLWNMSAGTAQGMFWLYAALMGVWFGVLVGKYTDESIARVFLITAASFGGLSLYGYTTPRSLSGWGSFLIMGLWGVFFASLAAWFFASTLLLTALSIISVLIFAGLTAYDTQQIKEMYFAGDDQAVASRKSILGATVLYISFVGIFQNLLYLLGDRE